MLAAATAAGLFLTPTAATARTVDDSTLTPHTHFTVLPLNPDRSVPAPPANGENIPNIDSVKSTIRAYYNATGGVASQTSSPYITQLQGIEQAILTQAPDPAPAGTAVVFDVDATLLADYDFEEAVHFNYDATVSAEWVADHRYPAVPGMADLVSTLAARGYDVYGVTGRPGDQQADTIANLTEQGFVDGDGNALFDADNLYTTGSYTPAAKPDYVDCAADGTDASCSTVEKKAFTRQHIQDSSGDTIVLNVGDQYSDLQGGYSLNSVKLPNPTYYLPSPDIAGAPSSDSSLALPTEFEMAADGSSGQTTPGDEIPNMDNVKAEIRAYYGATNGIASKTDSPYISQMASIADAWRTKLTKACTKGVKKKTHPAVVFDADDTTLMTYDMEDGAMKFNFDPTLQNTWVQEGRFPATPSMPSVVKAAKKAGCKIVGLTGRNNAQRVATLDNLARYYHDSDGNPYFKSAFYFTKWNTSSDNPPAYVDCGLDGNSASCSTIDYKASTRKYIEDSLGLHIVANFGDQFSDLIGGYSDKVKKLPNPTYYLP
ncbi:HAD family acid phosphatase [Nocardioides mangrovi]|uniref:Acid phosphatase n=1 Tax=Nocardioides mangrovi TaxID=2874580 RepID=A0ABS7U9R0_9ACTN|nr:HAD family acid phosphatase [Nocardioides mangrovi]MBZ5737567.1 hypothetical protein [Nocardioides mangrovi]